MLYSMVRPIATMGLKHYFRRIDIANVERIPKNAAVILAANHPTTFVEPCILACFLDDPIYFLARGDFFKKPFLAKLLDGVHITPVFRLRDGGYEKLKNNFESFEKSFETLRAHKPLMILAEGRCIHEKRLRPIRKGTARIALGALENTDLEEVYIVPIGVNYTYAERLRSDVMINCGEPIKASEYFKTYEEAPGKAINELTNELRDRLADEVIIIDKHEDELLVENLLKLQRSEQQKDYSISVGKDESQLRAEKNIADWVNQMDEAPKTELKALTNDYFGRLNLMRIDDQAFKNRYRTAKKQTRKMLLGLLPALSLLLWYLPPALLSQWIAGTKIKTIEFSSPVRWASLLLFYLIYTLLWVVVAAFTSWYLLAFVVVALFAGSNIIRYFETLKAWQMAWRAQRQTAHEVSYMKNVRAQIMERFHVLAKS